MRVGNLIVIVRVQRIAAPEMRDGAHIAASAINTVRVWVAARHAAQQAHRRWKEERKEKKERKKKFWGFNLPTYGANAVGIAYVQYGWPTTRVRTVCVWGGGGRKRSIHQVWRETQRPQTNPSSGAGYWRCTSRRGCPPTGIAALRHRPERQGRQHAASREESG
jgi:hypothetical protein